MSIVCVCVCVRACVRACVHACVCVCVQLLKYNLTILVLVSTQSYPPCVRSMCFACSGPLFKNYGSAPIKGLSYHLIDHLTELCTKDTKLIKSYVYEIRNGSRSSLFKLILSLVRLQLQMQNMTEIELYLHLTSRLTIAHVAA